MSTGAQPWSLFSSALALCVYVLFIGYLRDVTRVGRSRSAAYIVSQNVIIFDNDYQSVRLIIFTIKDSYTYQGGRYLLKQISHAI